MCINLKLLCCRNYCIYWNQILHNAIIHQPPNTLRVWSKYAPNKSKMADGGHIGKIGKLLNLLITFLDITIFFLMILVTFSLSISLY